MSIKVRRVMGVKKEELGELKISEEYMESLVRSEGLEEYKKQEEEDQTIFHDKIAFALLLPMKWGSLF
jgi:transcription antitermination factor NusG